MTEILSLSSIRVRKSVNYCYKKRGTDLKKEAKKIKSDNFTENIREKYNIAIAILEKLVFDSEPN